MSQSILAKVVLIGDATVGKTSIRRRYMGRGFKKQHLMTLGADFGLKTVEYPEINNEVRLQIWDIAGQANFKEIRSRFLLKANGVFMVFDLTQPKSFHHIPDWLNEVYQINKTYDIPVVVIGNKDDLEEQRVVRKQDVLSYIKKIKQRRPKIQIIDYIETSALTGHNIETCFDSMARIIIDAHVIDD